VTVLQTRIEPANTAHRPFDSVIVLVVGALMGLGVVMVYSASATVRGAAFDWRQWWNTPLKQGVFAFAGFLVMLTAAHMDYHTLAWRKRGDGWRAGGLAAAATLLLLAVLVPGIGHDALGARRQIPIPGLGFGFQPSEIAKVVIVIWLAALLSRPTGQKRGGRFPVGGAPRDPAALPPGDIRDLRTGFAPAVLSCGAMIALTALEDFGTAALMGAVLVMLLLSAGARWLHVLALGGAGLLGGIGLIAMAPYRRERIMTFFSETPDLLGGGYQVHQGLLAIGSGGWWGRGLGAGVQKYGYVPQDHNDFILAIICEELGVVGACFVIGLFVVLLWRGWRIAARAPDPFGQLLALGLTLMIGLQAAFNIAVVTNSVPTKGISLPFVSAGGSGVVFLGAAAGLLASIGRRCGAGGTEAAMRPSRRRA
jgi:cell division protein FtsW